MDDDLPGLLCEEERRANGGQPRLSSPSVITLKGKGNRRTSRSSMPQFSLGDPKIDQSPVGLEDVV